MSVRTALNNHIGKWCKVVDKDGFVYVNERSSDDLIGTSLSFLDKPVVSVIQSRMRSHRHSGLVVVITID